MRFPLLVVIFSLVYPLFLQPVTAEPLSETEQKIVAYIDANKEDAITLLTEVVNINSGTMNFDGVKKVAQQFAPQFVSLGFESQWITLPHVDRAGHLFLHQSGSQGKKLLLVGHLDTVFPSDSPFKYAERIGNQLRGPGTQDMKGGIIAMLYALKALQSVGALQDRRITIALLGDEENVGLPVADSRNALIAAAKEADIALEFEFSTQLNQAVTARRGISKWQLAVSSPPAHSSLVFSEQAGYGAIFEVARILDNFRQELLPQTGLTFNPGVILGGNEVRFDPQQSKGSANGKTTEIASNAVVNGDLRFMSTRQKTDAQIQMEVISRQNLPHTTTQLSFTDKYPAMEATASSQQLLRQLSQVSLDLGGEAITEANPDARGAADSCFTSEYTVTLGGLGAFGAGAHTHNEYLDLEHYPTIIKRAALLIYRLTHE